jgi:hypothetical protein
LAVLLGLVVLAFQKRYYNQLWDPLTVALVNGRPIPSEALNGVIPTGLELPKAANGGGNQLSIKLKLEQLIDEELIRQAAEKAGVVIEQTLIDRTVEQYRSSSGCQDNPNSVVCQPPKGEALKSFSYAVGQRLLWEHMASLVANRYARYDSREWRQFWRAFLLEHAMISVYRVRVLLTQDEPAVWKLLNSAAPKDTLDRLANLVKEDGFTVMITEPMLLNLLSPQTYLMFREAGLDAELAEAENSPVQRTGPVKLRESVAVFEIVESVPSTDPQELVAAAKSAYERKADEKAFNNWLAGLRQAAVIEINPGFLELNEAFK